ncbi:MAG: hypothetical protein ACI9Y1_002217 [Lentisphaeria bacterium]|jgi:hypothetical protein
MFPWYMNWAPVVHFPFSGAVEQDISPDFSRFFSQIPTKAGEGKLEKKIFETASYGKQIDVLTEVLLSLIENDSNDTALVDRDRGGKAKARLVDMYREINAVKAAFKRHEKDELFDTIVSFKEKHPDHYKDLIEKLPKP